MKKTTTCIFCGHLVDGEVIRTEAQNSVRLFSRISGTIGNVLSGNLFSAYRNARGDSQDSTERFAGRMAGGLYCHFDCPHCHQSFDKYVY